MKEAGNADQAASAINDGTIAPLVGKSVFYLLTDDEGGNDREGRKCAAVITRNYNNRKRDDQGRLVQDLFVMRPASWGGAFDKARVPRDSAREPGTWDTPKPGDERN